MICPALCLAAPLLFALPATPASESNPQAFEQGLKLTESLMSRGQWPAALDQLLKLVHHHARQPEVYQHRGRIEENVARCVFNAENDLPEIGDLISGKLLAYDRRTGKIKLLYSRSEDSLKDFVQSEGRLIHPLLFDGPYSVEVKGSYYPQINGGLSNSTPPTMLCGFEHDEAYLICFGFERQTMGNTVYHHRAYIARSRGEQDQLLDEKDSTPCKSGKPYSIKISVGPTQLSASYNGRPFLKGQKSKRVFGTIALENLTGWDQITFSGDAQTAWAQQIEDTARVKLRAEFEQSYEKTRYLPEWFFEDPPRAEATETATVAAPGERRYPGGTTAQLDSFFKLAMMHINRGDYERASEYVETLGDEISEELRCFLQAQSQAGLGRSEEALVLCDRIAALDPEFLESERLRLSVLLSGDDPDRAEEQLRTLLRRLPEDAELRDTLVRRLFSEGRLEEAHEVVRQALARGTRDEELTDFDRYLTLAAKGPNWSKTYEHQSSNYHVVSDIDVETCREASRLLESAYAAYSTRLKPVSGLQRRKFKVFLFSGQAGYEAHIQRILSGVRPAHTAGVYSGNLKQLFIWNQRDRESMLTTVRHEGFHQYLDRVSASTPTWFNEGLAEYYEVGGVLKGRWREGLMHEHDLSTLQEAEGLVPLERFVFMDREAFYKGSSRNYAQAWAFVHFLRHDPRDGGRRFSELFELLTRNVPAEQALKRVFGKTDWQELDQRFRLYVMGLQDR